MILLPRHRLTRQPQGAVAVDRANPFGARTTFLAIPGGPDAVTGLLPRNGLGTRANGFSTDGRARIYTNGDDHYGDGGALNPADGYWWLVRGYFTAFGSWSGVFGRVRDLSDSAAQNSFGWFRNGAGNLEISHAGFVHPTSIAMSTFIGTAPETWIGGWNGTQVRLYRNGNLIYSGSFSTVPLYTAGTGQVKPASNVDVNATSSVISMAACGRGGVDDVLASELGTNPWQLFRPLTRRLYVQVGSGPTTSYGAASLTGAGTLAGSGIRIALGSASLTGAGSLSAAGTRTALGAAALSGAGSLTATGVRTAFGVALLTGAGSLAATGVRIALGAASLTGAGTLTAYGSSGVTTSYGASTLAGAASLTATGLRTAFAAAALAGAGTLTVTIPAQTRQRASLLMTTADPTPDGAVCFVARSLKGEAAVKVNITYGDDPGMRSS